MADDRSPSDKTALHVSKSELDSNDSDVVSVRQFGAVGDGVTDDSAAVQAALDFVAGSPTGGTLIFPAGLYSVTGVTLSAQTSRAVFLRGAGKRSSVLTKRGASDEPVLTVDGGTVLEIYGGLEDLGFFSNQKICTGLLLKNVARLALNRISVVGFNIGVDVVGSLTFIVDDPSFNSNEIGCRLRKFAALPANLIRLTGGEMRANTSWAFDIDEAQAITSTGVDYEENGTSGNLSTGAVVLRGNMGEGTGVGTSCLRDNWFEANRGAGGIIALASPMSLLLEGNTYYSNEGGRDITIGPIVKATLINEHAPTAGTATVAISAGSSIILGGTITILNDTSTTQTWIDVGGPLGPRNRNKTNGPVGWADEKLGFYGTTPIVRPKVRDVATDAASTMQLANQLRLALTNLGLAGPDL